jgi:hypothetical protein
LCPDETDSTSTVMNQAEALNKTWELIPQTPNCEELKYDLTDVFRENTTENPIQKIMAPLLKLQKQRDRWRLSLLGVLDLRQHPEFVSWSLGVLVGMFNSKLFSQQRHSSMELCFAQVNSKLFRFISILT